MYNTRGSEIFLKILHIYIFFSENILKIFLIVDCFIIFYTLLESWHQNDFRATWKKNIFSNWFGANSVRVSGDHHWSSLNCWQSSRCCPLSTLCSDPSCLVPVGLAGECASHCLGTGLDHRHPQLGVGELLHNLWQSGDLGISRLGNMSYL